MNMAYAVYGESGLGGAVFDSMTTLELSELVLLTGSDTLTASGS